MYPLFTIQNRTSLLIIFQITASMPSSGLGDLISNFILATDNLQNVRSIADVLKKSPTAPGDVSYNTQLEKLNAFERELVTVRFNIR